VLQAGRCGHAWLAFFVGNSMIERLDGIFERNSKQKGMTLNRLAESKTLKPRAEIVIPLSV
jgi:hypothetical protein